MELSKYYKNMKGELCETLMESDGMIYFNKYTKKGKLIRKYCAEDLDVLDAWDGLGGKEFKKIVILENLKQD